MSFGEISPDGEWLTYTAADAGPIEVFALPLAEGGRVRRISTAGGGEGTWPAEGGGLFYRSGRLFYWVALTGNEDPPFAQPKLFIEGDFLDVPGMEYATSRDGKRLLLLQGPSESHTTTLNVITDWFTELDRLAPGN